MSTFAFTEEQEQFRDMVHRFLRDTCPTSEVRRLMASEAGFDAQVWQRLANELALPAIHIPEAFGGAGFGPVEVGIVMEECGRALLCAPLFSNLLGTYAILNAATESEKAELLPAIASGEARATLAFSESGANWTAEEIQLEALETDEGFLLNGEKRFVPDGSTADVLLVPARLPETSGEHGITLCAVRSDAAGVKATPVPTMDATRKLATIRFDGAAAQPIGHAGAAWPAIAETLDQAAIALSNEMVGGAQALFDSMLEYVKMRVQFGRTIGSFQAIKHRCADALLDVELAKSAAYTAAGAAAENATDWRALASLAKATTSECYVTTAATAIQLHGGIGFTWENDTHLWFKRAKSSEVLLAHPASTESK